jgi:hypothetical protein
MGRAAAATQCTVMALDKRRLHRQLVLIEVADAKLAAVDPARYRDAARALRGTVERELGRLPMKAFVDGQLPALETTAQNIFFEARGRFADLDGSGAALRARADCDALLRRMRRR